MILILSDIHFGKSDADTERQKESDTIALIRSVAPQLSDLYLLGDVFDHFIEYRYTMPKGFTRFLGVLGELADNDIDISYFLGNHDPWHRDFFQTEFNAEVISDFRHEQIGIHEVYLTHGDGKARTGGLYRNLKPVLRHRIPTTLYRYLLPGDSGVALARWSSRRFSARETNMETVTLMRGFADKILQNGADIVIMGHCHYAELSERPGGIYLNSGSWHDERTFGLMTEDVIGLHRWKDDSSSQIDAIPLAQHR